MKRVRTARTLMIVGTMGAFALHGLVPASAAPGDEESCFVSAINSARASAGVPSLSGQNDLLRIATSWSQTMADAGHIFHNPNLANLVPSNWQAIGENVGVGPTCDSIAQAFMNSPEHKRNILDSAYTTVGVGVVDSADGTVWVTEDFMGTGSAPAPVVLHNPAPAPVASVPAPKVTIPAPNAVVPVAAPTHAEPVAHTTPKPAVPAPLPTQIEVIDKPVTPAAAPTAAPIPVAVPIVDNYLIVLGNQTPDAAPTAGAGAGSAHHGFVAAIVSFFSHLL